MNIKVVLRIDGRLWYHDGSQWITKDKARELIGDTRLYSLIVEYITNLDTED